MERSLLWILKSTTLALQTRDRHSNTLYVGGVRSVRPHCIKRIILLFQKQIRRTRKKQKNGTKEARLRSMANPDRMQRLRMKFLDEAKRYMGVPYAKKYWKPEGEHTEIRLFPHALTV